jgi:hypothetical protein
MTEIIGQILGILALIVRSIIPKICTVSCTVRNLTCPVITPFERKTTVSILRSITGTLKTYFFTVVNNRCTGCEQIQACGHFFLVITCNKAGTSILVVIGKEH